MPPPPCCNTTTSFIAISSLWSPTMRGCWGHLCSPSSRATRSLPSRRTMRSLPLMLRNEVPSPPPHAAWVLCRRQPYCRNPWPYGLWIHNDLTDFESIITLRIDNLYRFPIRVFFIIHPKATPQNAFSICQTNVFVTQYA